MRKTLNARPLAAAATARLFEEVADCLDEAAAGGDRRVILEFEGDYLAAPAGTALPADPAAARALRLAAARLERSLAGLHESGGALSALTRGTCGGAFLEIALMADEHVMEQGAALAPAGLFDRHIPAAGGWSRLIERAGAGRAAGLLLASRRIGAAGSLAAGLCDRVGPDIAGDAPAAAQPPEPAASAVALRLAAELSERAGAGGGLTPRQARLLERASFALAFASGDPREGIEAFFEGRPARFGRPRSSDHQEPPDPQQDGADR